MHLYTCKQCSSNRSNILSLLKPAETPKDDQKEEGASLRIKKPAGAVSMFGGVNLFAGMSPPSSKHKDQPGEMGDSERIGEINHVIIQFLLMVT